MSVAVVVENGRPGFPKTRFIIHVNWTTTIRQRRYNYTLFVSILRRIVCGTPVSAYNTLHESQYVCIFVIFDLGSALRFLVSRTIFFFDELRVFLASTWRAYICLSCHATHGVRKRDYSFETTLDRPEFSKSARRFDTDRHTTHNSEESRSRYYVSQ